MSVNVGAVVLAAGLSRRMGEGRAKVLLPWRAGETVIESVVSALTPHTHSVVVVCGLWHKAIEAHVTPLGAGTVYNPDYSDGEMLSSFKTGLRAMPDDVNAVLIALGDQPRLSGAIVAAVIGAYADAPGGIVAPSYQMRRGHPLLIARRYWDEFLALPADGAPRNVITRHADAIRYVMCADDAILCDIDTPEAYALERAKAGLAPLNLLLVEKSDQPPDQ
ncbi:MAG: nucleotidyltransferase family protein [Chloroflexota bacterium]|nr:nucleotidyltransferase family protein [Chloroflexota bacterium]